VLIALGIVGSATLILMGFYGLFGKSLNQVTTLLPTLLLIIGVAESLHIFTEYFRASAHASTKNTDKNKHIAQCVAAVALPCFFTTITTVIGFLSLVTAPVTILKNFGLFGALGFLIEFFLAIALSAIGFSLLKVPQGAQAEPRILNFFLIAMQRLTRRHRISVLAVASVLVLLSLIGLTQLRVDTDSIGLFQLDNPVRRDSQFIEENFGFYTPLEFVIRARKQDRLKTLDALSKIEAWQERVQRDPRVSTTFALTDALKHLNYVLHQRAPDANKLPSSPEALEAALAYSAQVDPIGLKPYVNEDFTLTRITVSIKMSSAEGIRSVMQDLLAQAQGLFPSDITIEASGYLPLYVNLIEYLTRGQISSFALAFPLIFIPIGFFLRSAKLALLAVIPNLFPILLTLGLMGWLKIPLDIATVTIASIILGIVVDDTVHFLYGYKLARRASSCEEALSRVVQSTGRAMISTALILSLGFLVLAFASVKSIVYFGLLSSIALIAAVLGDLLVMAALLLTLKQKI
jgi:predicted RND superfamily exporter protein